LTFFFIDYDRQIGLVRFAIKNLVEATTALSTFGRDTMSTEICVPSVTTPSKEDSSRILKTLSRVASRLSKNPAIITQAIERDLKCDNTSAIKQSFHCSISISSYFCIPAYHCCTQNLVLSSDTVCSTFHCHLLFSLSSPGIFLRDRVRNLFNSLIRVTAGSCL
jgi:hypothetical protein